MPGARWFGDTTLNFAENLLRLRDEQPALIFHNERGERRQLNFAQLHEEVARIAVRDALDNRDGTLAGNGGIDLMAAHLNNAGGSVKALGGALRIDTPTTTLNNTAGTLAASGALDLVSAGLNNEGGLIQSGAAMTLDSRGATLVNTHAASHPSGQGGIRAGAALARQLGLEVHAGHGLNYEAAEAIAAIPEFVELNIGHFLVGEAVFVGLADTVHAMRAAMDRGRAKS